MILTRKEAKQQGLKKYFTGKPCLRGHIDHRATVNGICLSCVKLVKSTYDKAYRIKHRDEILTRDRARYAANPEKRIASPEKRAAAKKRYYEKHKTVLLSAFSARRAKKKDYLKAYFKEYKRVNSHKVAAWNAKRRADTLLRTPKWLSTDDYWLITEAYDLAKMRSTMFGFAWHVDHIIPLRGVHCSGLHVPNNLQVIPATDNLRKANKMPRVDARPDGRKA